MKRYLVFFVVALMALLAAACYPPVLTTPGASTPATGETVAPANTPTAVQTPAESPTVIASPVASPTSVASPVASPTTAGGSALPSDLQNRALGWLSGEAGISATDFRLVSAERTEWTDSCFGLGGPAESCLQAITPGWRIVFEAAGRQFEVRTDEAGGSFRLAPAES